MKKILTLALSLVFVVLLMPQMEVSAATVKKSGSCGENLTYTLTDDWVLTIEGSGAMNDYNPPGYTGCAPWHTYDVTYGYIEKVVLPDGITHIGNSAFESFVSLTEITLPDSVTSVGDYAFRDADIQTIDMSANVEKINIGAFVNCDELTAIELPEGLTSISSNVFKDCEMLTEMVIPSTVETIGAAAFKNCSGLKQLKFSGDAPLIIDYAFDGSSFTAYYPYGNETWTNDVISKKYGGTDVVWKPYYVAEYQGTMSTGVEWLITKNGELVISGNGRMEDYTSGKEPWNSYKSSVKTVIVEPGVTHIGNYSFQNCQSLKNVLLSGSVKTIGEYAFFSCTALESIEIPEGIEGLLAGVFYYCTELKEVKLPSSLKYMNSSSFNKCEKLESIVIPSGVSGLTKNIFSQCASLENVTIPDTVELINQGAFRNCSNLKNVYYQGSKKQWESVVVEATYNEYLEAATIHYGKYDITAGECENGSVAVDKATATAGETVAVTATPAEGYALVKVLVNGTEIDGTTFTPAADSTVTAVFELETVSGDVNDDGKINAIDATLVLKHSAELIALTEKQQIAADVSGDGKVNAIDATLILKYAADLISEF